MYYITNQTDQIIAADESLLELLHLDSIDDLTHKVILQEISFITSGKESIQIITSTDTFNFSIQVAPLSSMLGTLTLVHMDALSEKEIPSDDEILSIIGDDTLITDENISIEDIQSEETELTPKVEENALFDLTFPDETEINNTDSEPLNTKETLLNKEDELFELTLSDEQEENQADSDLLNTKETLLNENNELFELTLPESPEETIDDIILPSISNDTTDIVDLEKSPPTLDSTPIKINVHEVSASIGISIEDYNTFLNEYIDTAITLEQDLRSPEEVKQKPAIETLTQLADILQLPEVNTIIARLSLQPESNTTTDVEYFYNTLSRLTTVQDNNILDTLDTKVSPTFDLEEEIIEDTLVFNASEIDTIEEKSGFGNIILDEIKPIHFDFQLEEAANDLSLPVELIEEFVHDFIEQAHTETKKMLLFYEEGDLDSIQKIGHLLKGASSNLRINALSDTLYDIQFCEDSNQLEDLITRYWAHFLSFEQQIDIITK